MRLFAGLEIPEEARARLGDLRRTIGIGSTGWRWARAEVLHLTIRFFGETDPDRLPGLRSALAAAAAGAPGPVRFRCDGIGGLPSRGRPRVLVCRIAEPPPGGRLADLAARVEREAVALGYPAEPRPFVPHLTLARRNGPGGSVPERRDGPEVDVEAGELTLFESRLRPSGAEHRALARFRLGGSAG